MFTDPMVCPKCGSWNVEPTGRLHPGDGKRALSKGRLYSCEDCGWRGYIVRARRIPPAFVVIVVIIAVLAVVLIITN